MLHIFAILHPNKKDECIARADATLATLWDYISARFSAVSSVIETISLLDLLISFARTVAASPIGNFVRPSFTQTGNTDIQDARHPVFEELLCSESSDARYVSNPVNLSERSRLIILTGANSSGKLSRNKLCN